MNRLPYFLLSLALMAGLACSSGARKALVLDDFESPASLELWQGPGSISAEFQSHGKSSLALDLSGRTSRTLDSEKLPRDWSAYDLLRFDIYNPGSEVLFGSIQIFDDLGTDEQAETYGQSYNGGHKLFINRGWNHYEVQLKKAMVENGDRPLALAKIRRLRLGFGSASGILYLDNLRLLKGDRESLATASRIQPRDCVVRFDNYEVNSSLAVPFDSIVPPPEIVELRAQADNQLKRLTELVAQAETRGYQTLYWRIPLVTADVGLNVRRRLVWYQGEEQEKDILHHVIDSCEKASAELDSVLASGKPAPALEKQTLYVPPYPHFKGLKRRDGFFRYANGDPVILYAMHGEVRGPLLDYFATYNHVLESYTVGGASRFDTDKTPVYQAFQKYPDTHRVGWDGWCGHLIKDRWSMGGKKENVVICLESPHVKEAVLEYMKVKAEEWKKNPDLLYNIMAYELMYICYCDRSQAMFREWLKNKYGSLDKINGIWGASYTAFDDIRAPECKNAGPLPDINRAAWYDWACFNTRRFTDYLKWIKSEMRKLDPDVPICAGGTSSMLSAANSTTGIDEEEIINEVDDVILNESGHSIIFSDLMPSLSEKKMVMVEPEAGGHVHNSLLHFLHGKSTLAKYLWGGVNREYPSDAVSSIPHSWNISLGDIDEVLRIALDIRRIPNQIAAFYGPEPQVAILYSKTSIVQVPPNLHRAGRTPYLDAVYGVWQGSRFLGCRVGFVTEKQILGGKLSRFKILIVPAVKYLPPEVSDAVVKYVEKGGLALVVPESFLFDQYARQDDRLAGLGIKVRDVTLPPVLGEAESVQNYDQSITQGIVYGEVKRNIVTADSDIFRGRSLTLHSEGLAQTLDPGDNPVLARFEDGKPGLVLVKHGKGRLYYLAAPLAAGDYHQILAPLAAQAGLVRPITGVDASGELVTGAEVRSIADGGAYLVYASNLGAAPVEFDLKGQGTLGRITDLRARQVLDGAHVRLAPWQETIFRVEKTSSR
jgi:hypothetical protein